MLFDGDFLLVKAESVNREEYENDLNRLQLAVAGLSPEQKDAVFMHYFQDMTFDEIANLLNTSINTVASRCRYGLEKLKKELSLRRVFTDVNGCHSRLDRESSERQIALGFPRSRE